MEKNTIDTNDKNVNKEIDYINSLTYDQFRSYINFKWFDYFNYEESPTGNRGNSSPPPPSYLYKYIHMFKEHIRKALAETTGSICDYVNEIVEIYWSPQMEPYRQGRMRTTYDNRINDYIKDPHYIAQNTIDILKQNDPDVANKLLEAKENHRLEREKEIERQKNAPKPASDPFESLTRSINYKGTRYDTTRSTKIDNKWVEYDGRYGNVPPNIKAEMKFTYIYSVGEADIIKLTRGDSVWTLRIQTGTLLSIVNYVGGRLYLQKQFTYYDCDSEVRLDSGIVRIISNSCKGKISIMESRGWAYGRSEDYYTKNQLKEDTWYCDIAILF
jgi:hypothetical protein